MRRDNITPDSFSRVVEQHLPPCELWPDLAHALAPLNYPETLNLAERLLRWALVQPAKPAIIFGNENVSYDALRRRVLSFAAGLIARGIEPADRVALRLSNGPDFVAAWLAVQWIGAIAVQLSPLYRRREIERVVKHSGAVAIVCGAGLMADLGSAPPTCAAHVWSIHELAASSEEPPLHPTNRNHPAVITYITDADGPLRGVVHTPAGILAAADTYAREVLALTSDDICIGAVGLGWAFGLGALLTFPLRVGATTALLENPTLLLEAVALSRATVLFCVPTMYRILLRHPDLGSIDLRSLRCCVSAGEPLPPAVAEEWRARTGLEIVDGLGTTELTHVFISARSGAVRHGLVGTPVTGYEARILGEDDRQLPDGCPGKLAVRGPTGALYWRDTELQRRTVRNGWTLTGDICIRHADGWFQYVGRADRLVVSAGYKISIREVEETLERHPDVSKAHVFSEADPVRGAVVKAVVVRAAGAREETMVERLRQYMKGELAPFKCPREIRIR